MNNFKGGNSKKTKTNKYSVCVWLFLRQMIKSRYIPYVDRCSPRVLQSNLKYFKCGLLPYSHGVTTGGSSACLIGMIFLLFFFRLNALFDTIPEGFVSPPRIKSGSFHLLGKYVNHSTLELL